LTELFDNRRGDRVDYATYEELGGVSGTLVKRAEGLLTSLGDEAHEVARQVFLRLVTLNEGADASADEIIAFTRDRLAHFKCPDTVEFCATPPADTAC
jgi:hypothetical protein